MKSKKLILSLFVLVVVLLWLLWPDQSGTPVADASRGAADSTNLTAESRRPRKGSPGPAPEEALAESLPKGTIDYLYDKAPNGRRFLLAKGQDGKFLPHSDAPSGKDLWIQDESGEERLINQSVYRAKFSPDGSKIAFTTSDCVLHIQDLQGNPLGQVPSVYFPSWKPDGSGVVFAQVPAGQDPHRPGTRNLAAYDLASGQIVPLTDGRYDDGRPEVSPSSDWVLFVSGARSGLASFWQVPVDGGEPVQLTNRGMQQVNEQFIPTPYDKSSWSADNRWFVYDVKSGDQQETWGLEFDATGKMKQAKKLSDGVNPRWQDSRTFVSEKQVDGVIETFIGTLP